MKVILILIQRLAKMNRIAMIARRVQKRQRLKKILVKTLRFSKELVIIIHAHLVNSWRKQKPSMRKTSSSTWKRIPCLQLTKRIASRLVRQFVPVLFPVKHLQRKVAKSNQVVHLKTWVMIVTINWAVSALRRKDSSLKALKKVNRKWLFKRAIF